MNNNILTKEGKLKLEDELKNLIEVERPKVIQAIKEARAQGDLSENAEFDAAREEQGRIEDRIREIQAILDNSKIDTSKSSSNRVRVGSKVTILNEESKEQNIYRIVGTLEADPSEGNISNVSPVGAAILNKSENDVAEVTIETKMKIHKFKVKIVKVENN